MHATFGDRFRNEILNKIKVKVIMICHGTEAGGDYSPRSMKAILENPYIAHWYSHLADQIGPKVTPIPIGITRKFAREFGNYRSLRWTEKM